MNQGGYRVGPIDWRARGFPALAEEVDPADVGARGWNLFDGRFLLPIMILRESALAHDLAAMADRTRAHGVSLAPHGKTTMAPAIWRRQLDAGAWALTLATPWQARLAARLGMFPGGNGQERRLPVLVEVGLAGTRAGVRRASEALAVARRAVAARPLQLAGVAFFEGTVAGATRDERVAAVRRLTDLAREVALGIDELVRADGGTELILSGGGSAYVDTLVEELTRPLGTALPVWVVVRSGHRWSTTTARTRGSRPSGPLPSPAFHASGPPSRSGRSCSPSSSRAWPSHRPGDGTWPTTPGCRVSSRSVARTAASASSPRLPSRSRGLTTSTPIWPWARMGRWAWATWWAWASPIPAPPSTAGAGCGRGRRLPRAGHLRAALLRTEAAPTGGRSWLRGGGWAS